MDNRVIIEELLKRIEILHGELDTIERYLEILLGKLD